MTRHKIELGEEELSSNPYYIADSGRFSELLELVNGNPFSFHRMLTAKGRARDAAGRKGVVSKRRRLLDWVESVVPPVLKSRNYRLATKVFWILRGLTDFPECQVCGSKSGYVGKNVRSAFLGYFAYCCRRCMQASPVVSAKRAATNVANNGVEFPAQNPEIMGKTLTSKREKYGNAWGDLGKQDRTNLEKYGKEHPYEYGSEEFRKLMVERFGHENPLSNPEVAKRASAAYRKSVFEKYGTWPMRTDDIKQKSMDNRAKSYEYGGKSFDSKPEIAYYVWLTDRGKKFEYHPKDRLAFEFGGKEHRYFPDFKVLDEKTWKWKYVELKGEQFFRPDGTMYCPYRSSKWDDAEYAKVCALYEAKRRFMLGAGVEILREDRYSKYLDYVDEKYGRGWLDQFRRDTVSK